MSKNKNRIDKVKELYNRIDDTEKEAIVEAGKEVVEVVKEVIAEKKATGKWDKTLVVATLATLLSLGSIVYQAVQPDSTEYTDEAINGVKTEMSKSVSSLQEEINTTKDSIGVTVMDVNSLKEVISIDERGNVTIGK